MFSKEDFKNAGFDVSINLEQATIDRAEADIEQAYITPILSAGTTTPADCVLRYCRLNLIYLLLLQRSAQVTRAGAKVKYSAQSTQAAAWDVLAEMGGICALFIDSLINSASAPKSAKFDDICKIFFKTNFISN